MFCNPSDELQKKVKNIVEMIYKAPQSNQMSQVNWIGIDFSILPPYVEAEEGHIPSDEGIEEYIPPIDSPDDICVPIDSPDDICAVCYTKLRWINLYYQCPDCKRIYG